MAVIIDEHTQYVDIDGKPLVGGTVTIGEDGSSDPENDKKDIFSDEALTIPLANPQTLNDRGQTENKIFLSGKYSFLLKDSEDNQIELDTSRGEDTATSGNISLTNVAGINDLTAQGSPNPIDEYTDKQPYTLTLVNAPTGAMTLNIDSNGVVDIKANGFDIVSGQFSANEVITVTYNSIGPVFELSSNAPPAFLKTPLDTNGNSIYESEGSDVASSAQPNIWGGDGNTVHITGTTQIDDFTDAPRVGAKKTLIFDDTLTITTGNGITLQGGQDIVTQANDRLDVYADAVDAFSGTFRSILGAGLQSMQTFTNSGTWNRPAGINRVFIICTGGGGGGSSPGNGGGAAATVLAVVTNFGSSETITIGAGGTDSAQGGTSSFGSLVTAGGGFGNGNGSTTGTGGLVIDGGDGGRFNDVTTAADDYGGHGGASFFGGGGLGGRAASISPENGPAYGSGGGGSGNNAVTGATGRNGVIIVLEFGL